MIGVAIAYWLIINTIGVSAIVASMCRPNEKPVIKTDEKVKTDEKAEKPVTKTDKKPVVETEDKYPSDYFTNLCKDKEQELIEQILDRISKIIKSSNSGPLNIEINPNIYKRISFKTLYNTFVLKYGFYMCDGTGDPFTKDEYNDSYILYLRRKDK